VRATISALLLVLSAGAITSLSAATVEPTHIEVTDQVVLPNARRLGINVGGRSRWGAAQLRKNLIDNPGFESGLYGTVFHAATGATGTRVPIDFWNTAWNNDTYGIGMPEDFWNGGEYEIVHGPAEGRAGTISDFTHESDRYVMYLDADGTAPSQWDVLFARRELPGPSGADTAQIRPGSPGSQSLRLEAQAQPWQAAYDFYMDSSWRDGDRSSGKMLIVEGNWRFEIWARGDADGSSLRFRFFREGEADFLDETIALTDTWQHIERDFSVAPGTDVLEGYTDADYHPILGFSLYVPQAGDTVWVDDVALFNADDTNPTVFTDSYVDALRDLNPGVLRNWKTSEFGSTLENMIAEPWARRTTGWRPHERRATEHDFSMHEFFELCALIGAEPWQVLPPTMPQSDMANLAEYLAGPADGSHPWADARAALGQTAPWTDVFDTIHLEFGNELWGAASGSDPFYGASLLGGQRLASIAHDRFEFLRSSPFYDANDLDLIIGGQAGFPGRQQEIEANSTNHDTVALAPYFGVLSTWNSDDEIFGPLFARPLDDVTNGRVQQSQDFIDDAGNVTATAIYEINFHTTGGSAPIDIRNGYLTGAGGAIALPLHMLTMMEDLGVNLQCAFSSLQYAFRLENGDQARLWGMLRDVEATGRRRPTWLGVELANRAIRGAMVATVQSGADPTWSQSPINGVSESLTVPEIQSFAFHDGGAWSVILFNLSRTETLPVTLDLPASPEGTATRHQIAPASIHDDNEDSVAVTIETAPADTSQALDLPPHSVTAIIWDGPALATTSPGLVYR
jgi:hypothetical protein